MKCRQAQTEIALWVGESLNEQTEDSLRQHLAECGACRAHYFRLQTSLNVLHCVECPPAEPPAESLWPRLASRMADRRPVTHAGRGFAGWTAVVALAVSCASVVVVASQSVFQSVDGNRAEQAAATFGALPVHLRPDGMTQLERRLTLEGLDMLYGRVVPVDLSGHGGRPHAGPLPGLLMIEYECPHCGKMVAGPLRFPWRDDPRQ